MAYQLKKIFSNNPFLDHIVYQAKYIALNCVTKSQKKADQYETTETARNYDIYLACTRNPDWTLFDSIPYEVLKEVLGHKYTDRQIRRIYVPYKDNIPEEDRPAVIEAMAKRYIANFEEKNDYYREIMGYRPSYSKERIYLADYGFENDLVVQQGKYYTFLDELPDSILYSLIVDGTIKKIINDYPDEKWVAHIPMRIDTSEEGTDTLSLYMVRHAEDFDLLYIPSDADEIIKEQFAERYEVNQDYILGNVYSEAMKYQSEDYYDDFIQILILTTTMLDMFDTVQDHIVRRDIFDARCIEYIFEQHNVPYFSEIPLKYQAAMMKNLNMLLKFKSTARCMIDLCSLFGFESSEIFQFYLLRKRKLDENGEYIFNYKTVTVPNEVEEVVKQSSVYTIANTVKVYIPLNPPIEKFFDDEDNYIEIYLNGELAKSGLYIVEKENMRAVFDNANSVKNTISVYLNGEQLSYKDYRVEDGRLILTQYNTTLEIHINGEVLEDYTIEDFAVISDKIKENKDIHVEYYYKNPEGSDIRQETQEEIVEELNLPETNEPIYIDLEYPEGYLNADIKGMSVMIDTQELDSKYWNIFNNQLRISYNNVARLAYKIYINYTWKDPNYIALISSGEDVDPTNTTNHSITLDYPVDDFGSGERDSIEIYVDGKLVDPSKYIVSGNKIYFLSDDILEGKEKIIAKLTYGDEGQYGVDLDYLIRNILKTYVVLNYPIEDYFSGGNKIEVWINGQLLPEEYYSVYDDKLYIEKKDILNDYQDIEVKYIYNDGSQEINIPDHSILMADESLVYTSSQSIYDIHPPTENYFDLGGYIFIILGTLLLHEDCYDILPESNQIMIHNDILSHYKFTKDMKILYMYSEAIDINKKDADVTATQDGQTSFVIPEPFEGYYEAGGRFFVSVGGGYIHESRYHIEGNTLIFNNANDSLKEGKVLTFHFIYNLFSNVAIKYENVTLTATVNNQTTFTIPLPYENYLADGNPVFVKVRGKYIDSQYYDILKNQIVLNTNYSLYPGATLELEFVYGSIKEIKHTMVAVRATITVQQDFNIPFPYDGFLVRGNKLKVRYKGVEYREGVDYIIKGNMLEIFSVSKAIPKDDVIEFHFYTNVNNENHVTVSEAQVKMYTEDQTIFTVPVPFFNYFNTGNKMIVTLGGLFVSPDTYQLVDNRLEFTDPGVIGLIKDRELNFTFIYHTIYLQYNKQVNIDYDTYSVAEEKNRDDGSLKIKIPFPFDNYLELGNTFEMRVDGITLIPEEAYDVIDNEYAIIFDPDTYIYPYGDTVQFVFTYSSNGYEEVIQEDLEKDIELKFVKIPILENPDNYLKDESNYIDYDAITNADPSWDGDYLHNEVKQALIEKEFSYNRTKYFGISSLTSMGKIAYQLPYFMNIIFDKFKTEERLKLRLPYINTGHQFRFNDVLTYMMALSHRFIGVEDDIPNIQRTLYIHGFNFETDLATLSAHIQEKVGNNGGESRYQISDKYLQFKKYKNQIPTYKELIELYTNNTEIYNHVVDEMLHAENKIIYDIYKKIYDALMITKYSKEYFSINRTVQPTLTAWLKYRDNYLYESLIGVDAITEEEDRKKTISTYLEDCVYQLEEYLDSEEFRFLLGSFHGVDKDAIMKYLATVIDFFKSYKIQIYDTAIQYVFDDKLENTMRPIDLALYYSTFDIDVDGHTIFEKLYFWSKWTNSERISEDIMKEQLKLIIRQYLKLNPEERINVVDYINNMLITMLLKEKVEIPQLIDMLIDFMIKDNYDDCIDLIKSLVFIQPEDKVAMIEKITAIIKEYKQSIDKDMYKLHDDITRIFVNMKIPDGVHLAEELFSKISIILNDIHADPEDRVFMSLATMTFIDFEETRDNIRMIVHKWKNNQYKDIYEVLSDLSSILVKMDPKDANNIIDRIATKSIMNLMDSDSSTYDKVGEYYAIFNSKDMYNLKEKVRAIIKDYLKIYAKDKASLDDIPGELKSMITPIDGLEISTKAISNSFITMMDRALTNYDKFFYQSSFTEVDRVIIRDFLAMNRMHTDSRRYNDRYEVQREILDIFTFYRVADRMKECLDKVTVISHFYPKEKDLYEDAFIFISNYNISDDTNLDDIPSIFRRVFDTKQYQDAINIQDQAIVKTFG